MTVKPRAQEARLAICRRLAFERMIRGLSQRDVAAAIDGGQGLISAVETGARTPYLETVISIAEVLGLDVALVGEHHSPLLDLTAGEVKALVIAAASWADNDDDADLTSALNKLRAEQVPDPGQADINAAGRAAVEAAIKTRTEGSETT